MSCVFLEVFFVTVVLVLLHHSSSFNVKQNLQLRTQRSLTLNMMFGLLNNKKSSVKFLPSNVVVEANTGDQLSDVAKKSGVEIKYKCKKGECGTCEVNINNKWVKACQTTIPKLGNGEILEITLRPALAAKSKSAEFFSPKSFVEGVVNNGLGVVGFVAKAAKADDEFDARMRKEKELEAKVAARKAAKEGGQR